MGSLKFNRKKFFDGFKQYFDHNLDQSQVDGIEFLLASFEADELWTKDLRNIAYAFATIYHETAASMQPVEEGYYLGKKAKSFQKTLRYYPYYGRGYVQLTWKTNYQVAGKALDVDLVDHPEKALEKENAFWILTFGMFRGWFSKGNTLGKYIHGDTADYKGARRIINGTDKADLIAEYAEHFHKILVSAVDSTTGSEDQAGTGSVSTDDPAPNSVGGGSNGQDQPPSSDNVAVEKEVQVGFFTKIWKELTGWTIFQGGLATLQSYKESIDALGLPGWIIAYAIAVAFLAFLIWFIYRLAKHLLEWWGKRTRTDALVTANANTPGKVVVVCPEDLDAFEKAGWTVIRRENAVPPTI